MPTQRVPQSPTTPTTPGVVAAAPTHVVVVLPEDQAACGPAVASQLAPHAVHHYVPCPAFPVRNVGRRLLRPHRDPLLWQVARRPDGIWVTAAGPRGRLDLHTLSRIAGWHAHQRWQAGKTLVASGTTQARDWESFLTPRPQHHPLPPLDELRRQFEAQPRVLAMIAVNAQRVLPFRFDLDELAAFQAGEQVYCTLAAQQAVVGQLLVLPGGLAYRPVTSSVADRLRYLRAALDVVEGLHRDRHLVAMTRTRTDAA